MTEKEDKNFESWLRTNAKHIENTENKFVLNDKIYTVEELYKHFSELKVTEVDILGYDRHFTVKLYSETFFSLDQVIDYVSKDIVDTAIVKQIRHLNWLGNRTVYIDNPAYTDRNACNGETAKPYLKNDIKINEVVKF